MFSVEKLNFMANGKICIFSYHEINCVGLRVGIATRLRTGRSGLRIPVKQETFLCSKMSRLAFQTASY
jgi:hypothetical protein